MPFISRSKITSTIFALPSVIVSLRKTLPPFSSWASTKSETSFSKVQPRSAGHSAKLNKNCFKPGPSKATAPLSKFDVLYEPALMSLPIRSLPLSSYSGLGYSEGNSILADKSLISTFEGEELYESSSGGISEIFWATYPSKILTVNWKREANKNRIEKINSNNFSRFLKPKRQIKYAIIPRIIAQGTIVTSKLPTKYPALLNGVLRATNKSESARKIILSLFLLFPVPILKQ